MDKIEENKRLESLLKDGIISKEEFDILKKKSLDEQSNSSVQQINVPPKILKQGSYNRYKKVSFTIFIVLTAALLVFGIINNGVINQYLSNEKKQLSNGDLWIISDSITLEPIKLEKGITFRGDTIISSSENKIYLISWLNENTYSQKSDGNSLVVKLKRINKNSIQAVFLKSTKDLPTTGEDWARLKNDGKVKYFNKLNSESKFSKTDKITIWQDKKIALTKLPSVGMYVNESLNSYKTYLQVQVIDGKLIIQTRGKYDMDMQDNDITYFQEYADYFQFDISELPGHWEYHGGNSIDLNDLGNGRMNHDHKFIKLEKSAENYDLDPMLANLFGNHQNGNSTVRVCDYVGKVDNQYSEYSCKNLIFSVAETQYLSNKQYSYPFDLLVVLLKIYPDDYDKYHKGGSEEFVSGGAVVFENIYGCWSFLSMNLLIVPSNPKKLYRDVTLWNPEINRSNNTIRFHYIESYLYNGNNLSYIRKNYAFSPYLDEITMEKEIY